MLLSENWQVLPGEITFLLFKLPFTDFLQNLEFNIKSSFQLMNPSAEPLLYTSTIIGSYQSYNLPLLYKF